MRQRWRQCAARRAPTAVAGPWPRPQQQTAAGRHQRLQHSLQHFHFHLHLNVIHHVSRGGWMPVALPDAHERLRPVAGTPCPRSLAHCAHQQQLRVHTCDGVSACPQRSNPSRAAAHSSLCVTLAAAKSDSTATSCDIGRPYRVSLVGGIAASSGRAPRTRTTTAGNTQWASAPLPHLAGREGVQPR
jgi:hypothetical protein